jgi:hypothetical protein
MRLLLVLVAALAATLAPLASTAAVEEPRTDCCEQTTHQSDNCAECIVCVSGLCCVLPAGAFPLGDNSVVIGRLDWSARVGLGRNDPPPLPPPRHPIGPFLFSNPIK